MATWSRTPSASPRRTPLAPPIDPIIDDGEPGFTTIGGWVRLLTNGRLAASTTRFRAAWLGDKGYLDLHRIDVATTSSQRRGPRQPAAHERTLRSPSSMAHGRTSHSDTPRQSETQRPNDFSQTRQRGNLAVVTITGNELVVELTDEHNGYVIADAIFVRATTDAPNTIIDNGDPGFTSTPGWTLPLATQRLRRRPAQRLEGDGSRIDDVDLHRPDARPMRHDVSAVWTAFTNRHALDARIPSSTEQPRWPVTGISGNSPQDDRISRRG
ncbi:MAG: hypothetical protein R3C02_20045 [Planctomycetaceae bacterium]